MAKIRVAIVGVGNCASSLVQGIHFYNKIRPGADNGDVVGLMHPVLGGLAPRDVEVVAAFDVDKRKVGKCLHEAIFAAPNNTAVFFDKFRYDDVKVKMGEVLDGVADHMAEYAEHQRFVVANRKPVNVAKALKDSGAEVVINYLPVGSQKATEFYAEACLEAGCALVNCIPVFIASDPDWAKRFADKGLPIVGDDIKAQIGATITHRVLARLMYERGVSIDATYQLNTGGNTDFLNMLNHARLSSKRVSKTDAVQSQLRVPLPPDQVHIGPSDYVAWQKDNKVCFLRLEGRGFGEVPMHMEMRLSVEDSPNSGGVSIDAIRCAKLALERRVAGPLHAVSAYTMKHPPQQFTDNEAREMLEQFIRENALD